MTSSSRTPPRPRSGVRTRSRIGQLAVLVAEPHVDFAVFLGELLGDEGHDAVVVFTGEQAQAELLGRSFDVVLVASSTVGPMKGVALARDLADARRPEAVIVMTDFRSPDVERDARAAGAAGCLAKPFGAAQLTEALVAAVTRHAAAPGDRRAAR